MLLEQRIREARAARKAAGHADDGLRAAGPRISKSTISHPCRPRGRVTVDADRTERPRAQNNEYHAQRSTTSSSTARHRRDQEAAVTDHYAVVNPEALQPWTPTTPHGGLRLRRVRQGVHRANAVGGHRRQPTGQGGSAPSAGDVPSGGPAWRATAQHAPRAWASNGPRRRKPCPECGKAITAKDIFVTVVTSMTWTSRTWHRRSRRILT